MVACPWPLVGLTGLGISGGTYLAVGTGGCVVTAGGLDSAGLTAGFGGMDLVLAPESNVGI